MEDDLEDGEIASDEEEEQVVVAAPPSPKKVVKSPSPEPPRKPSPKPEPVSKSSSSKSSSSDKPKRDDTTSSSKSTSKSKKQQQQQQQPVQSQQNSSSSSSKQDKYVRYKSPTEDWAGDVEKAIRAVLEEEKMKKSQEKSKNTKNSRSTKNRKRSRDDRDDERSKDQKKKRLSDEENGNDDEEEMMFIRGASPSMNRRGDMMQDLSPPRRTNEHCEYDSGSDYDDRQQNYNRHRDNDKRQGGGRMGGNRRGGKNDRGNKNKGRGQMRNERNNRRNNQIDQDPDAICVYYMQGKCHRGDDCPYSHNALPPRKMELCKFYLMECCAKRDKCLYMHHDFPCKFYHTGLKCLAAENCKFSHEPLTEQVKNILLKHLETAPKEILGDFPRLSREGALMMINNTQRNHACGEDSSNSKIPSLFELNVHAPRMSHDSHMDMKDDDGMDHHHGSHRPQSRVKDRKTGKKTRWGSDDDRVPYNHMVLLQAASAIQQLTALQNHAPINQLHQLANPSFYNAMLEATAMKQPKDEPNELAEYAQGNRKESASGNSQDIDLRQLLASATVANANKSPQVMSIAEQLTKLVTQPKIEDDSLRDDNTNWNDEHTTREDKEDEQDKPSHLPKLALDLFTRIQQQQKAAQESFKNLETEGDETQQGEDWYSDDDGDDDDDDNLQIVIKEPAKEETEEPALGDSKETDTQQQPDDEQQQPSAIPQPAMIVDKIGSLSKIDISAEVSKLLSTIKAQSGTSKTEPKQEQKEPPQAQSPPHLPEGGEVKQEEKKEIVVEKTSSPRPSSPKAAAAAPVSRDPRMSRDPRQRREEAARSSPSSASTESVKKEPITATTKSKIDMSIYASGMNPEMPVDTDLRAKMDQDLRRRDMDLRQNYATFGDTDLRLTVGGGPNYADVKSADVDLRQMLSLPFKPAPSHVPCVEVDASISSHPPLPYKVYIVDVPRPDYTGLKVNKADPQVISDPRLRKMFGIAKVDIADSPMSPPPMCSSKRDTPKSPPLVAMRSDPRRKAAMEVVGSAMMMQQPQQQDMSVAMGMQGMQIGQQNAMLAMTMPTNMMMQAPQMVGPQNHQANPMMQQSQMNYDPRYTSHPGSGGGGGGRGMNNGVGLLGAGPNYDSGYEGQRDGYMQQQQQQSDYGNYPDRGTCPNDAYSRSSGYREQQEWSGGNSGQQEWSSSGQSRRVVRGRKRQHHSRNMDGRSPQ